MFSTHYLLANTLAKQLRSAVAAAARFRPTEAKARGNDTKAMLSRMDAMARGDDDGKFDE